jgi:hypothetical protein
MSNKIHVLCEQCSKETNHEVIATQTKKSSHEDEYNWSTDYQIVMCCGCDTISFREEKMHEYDYDPETGEPILTVKLYPPRMAGRRPFENCYYLPQPLVVSTGKF